MIRSHGWPKEPAVSRFEGWRNSPLRAQNGSNGSTGANHRPGCSAADRIDDRGGRVDRRDRADGVTRPGGDTARWSVRRRADWIEDPSPTPQRRGRGAVRDYPYLLKHFRRDPWSGIRLVPYRFSFILSVPFPPRRLAAFSASPDTSPPR